MFTQQSDAPETSNQISSDLGKDFVHKLTFFSVQTKKLGLFLLIKNASSVPSNFCNLVTSNIDTVHTLKKSPPKIM